MRFSVAALLPALALAAPIAEMKTRDPSGYFTILAARSGSPIHFGSVNAAGQRLYIGVDSATYCPTGISGLDCSAYNTQVTSFITANTEFESTCGLDTVVPGGQSLYVAADGAVGFTQAHSGSIPDGALRSGFVYTAPTSGGPAWGTLSFTADGATGFLACPVADDENIYQIFADVSGFDNKVGCLGFNALANGYKGASTWQYI